MPFGKKRKKKEILELKEKILILLSQAVPDRKIFKALNLPQKTFYRYLDEINKDLKERFLERTDRIISGRVNRSMNRMRLFHQRFEETQDIRALDSAERTEENLSKFFQDIGVLDRSAEKIKLEGTIVTYKEPEWLKEQKTREKKNDEQSA